MTEMIKKRAREIWAHQGFQRYFRNMGWMFFGQMFSLSVSFFIGAWLARYLGPENYGIFNYSLAFVGLFAFISSFGIDGILSRELVKFPEKRDLFLGTAFVLKIFGGFIAFLLCFLSIFLFNFNYITKILVFLYSFNFILQSINVINIYFQAEVKSKNSVKAQLFSTLLSSVLKVGIILLNKGIIWIMLVYALDFLWQGISFIRVYEKLGLKIKDWRFDYNIAKSILLNSWPLMLSSAAWFIYLRIDQVIIGGLLNNFQVGIYSAAVKVVEIWYFIPGVICGSLFPAIINSKKIDETVYKQRLNKFYLLMLSISILLTVVIVLFATPIIYLLFGPNYSDSINVLRVYSCSSIGLFLGSAITQYLISENLVKNIFWLNFVAMIINITLNFLFIPIFGILGAAWATFISYLAVPVGGLFIGKIRRKNNIL